MEEEEEEEEGESEEGKMKEGGETDRVKGIQGSEKLQRERVVHRLNGTLEDVKEEAKILPSENKKRKKTEDGEEEVKKTASKNKKRKKTELMEFELRPNYDLVSPNFVLVVRGDKNYTELEAGRPTACIYQGVAKGNPGVSAALSNCDGNGFVSRLLITDMFYFHFLKFNMG